MKLKKSLAFSLIEIMVGIIVISMLVAAFAPVITKKVSSTATTLSSALGLGIDSRIFLYNESKNKIDGCKLSYDKTYLQCPFKVPEGVSSINVAISGAGGGGAGAYAYIEDMSSVTSFVIDEKVKNIKIPYLVSAGGNGGVGNTHLSTDTTEIKPASQADCDKIKPGALYYVGQSRSCVTKKNLSEDDVVNHSIKKLVAHKAYSTDQGNKVCWSTTGSYYVGFSEHKLEDKADSNIDTYFSWYITKVKSMPDYPVCSYPAAKEICDLYAAGASYDGYATKFRLINGSEADWIATNHPITLHAFTKSDSAHVNHYRCISGPEAGSGKVPKGTESIGVNELQGYDGNCHSNSSGSPTNSITYNYKFNPCLPEYAWGQDKNYYLLKSSPSSYRYKRISLKSTSHYYCHNFSVRAEFDTCKRATNSYVGAGFDFSTVGDNDGFGCLSFLNKERSPFSVRCAVDKIGENTTTTTKTFIGGGGASGAAITDVVIPNNLLYAWRGATVTIIKGKKSSFAGYSGSGSAVQIVKNGRILFALSVRGGTGGYSGGTNAHGSGGSTNYTKKFTYNINGTKKTSSEYSYRQNVTLPNGVSFNFAPGNDGLDGSYGGIGGLSPAPVNIMAGAGGQGGSASDSYSQAQDGYVLVSYQNIYKGASGGGGSGGAFARIENIPVKEGKTITIKVGRGGVGGAANNKGSEGGITSFSYDGKLIYFDGGEGGYLGTGAKPASPNFNPVHGSGGDQVSYSISSSYKSLVTIAQMGLAGTKGHPLKDDNVLIAATGGVGGNSGINEWSLDNSISASELSYGCGGMLNNSYYYCYNDEVDGIFSQSDFSNPGKVYKTNNKDYGSAGTGGGGGGVNYETGEIGKGSNGQNGYIMLWWDSPQ